MADERARPRADGDRRPDPGRAALARELLGARRELSFGHPRPNLELECTNDVEGRPLRRHELGRRGGRYPASHRTAWSQKRAYPSHSRNAGGAQCGPISLVYASARPSAAAPTTTSGSPLTVASTVPRGPTRW